MIHCYIWITFNSGDESEFFFAEAKDTDNVTKNQLALFPIIERYLCPVVFARIKAQ